MLRHRHLAVGLFLLATACATTREPGVLPPSPTDDLREFQLLQSVFRTQYTGAHVLDFPGHGRVTVREISLDGFPGHSYVRCRFHYQNRTAAPVMQAWVSLDVLDAEGEVANSQTVRLVMPTSTAIARGSYFSEELRTPTNDAHLRPGWSWRLRCVSDAEQADEPLDPPVQEWQPRVYEPVIIKDRNWPYPTWYHQATWQPRR
jgi:hypothetical protein